MLTTNPEAEITENEKLLEQIIYELYNIADEEQKIIEGD